MNKKHIKGKDITICVDVALNKTGISIMSGMTVLHTEVLAFKAHHNYYDKLTNMNEFFVEFFTKVDSLGPKSVELVMEGRLTRGFSGAALASIEGARVTVYHAFHSTRKTREKHDKMSVYIYSPGVVKKYIAGKQNASKDAMKSAALSRFSSLRKIKFQEDIYDAIYLGIYHNNNKRKGSSAASTRGKKVP